MPTDGDFDDVRDHLNDEIDRLKAVNAQLLKALIKTERNVNQLCDMVLFFKPKKVRKEDWNEDARAAIKVATNQ